MKTLLILLFTFLGNLFPEEKITQQVVILNNWTIVEESPDSYIYRNQINGYAGETIIEIHWLQGAKWRKLPFTTFNPDSEITYGYSLNGGESLHCC